MTLNAALTWYQNKIGTYDKQSWERNVEKCILKGFSNVPKKSAKIKTDFIDVDLVRGTTFPKAKPQHGMLVVARKAFIRTLFLPLFLTWWQQQTTRKFTYILLMMYILQLSVILIYFSQSSNKDWEEISFTEIISPVIMMVVLGVIHSQVVSTYNPASGNITSCESLRRKRMKRRRQSKSFCKPSTTSRRSCNSGENLPTNDQNLKSFDQSNLELVKNSIKQSSSSKENKELKEPENFLETNDLPQLSCDSNVSLNRAFRDLLSQNDKTDSNKRYEKWTKCEACAMDSILEKKDRNSFDEDNEEQTSDEARHDSAVQDVSSVEIETDQVPSDTELENSCHVGIKKGNLTVGEGKCYVRRRRLIQNLQCNAINIPQRLDCNSSCESEADTTSPNTPIKDHTSSLDMEWGMTTNTDGDQSYESDISEETEGPSAYTDDPFCWDYPGVASSTVLNPSCTASDKGSRSFKAMQVLALVSHQGFYIATVSSTVDYVPLSCTIWEGRECKKADLCVLDISSAIVRKVALMPESIDYFICGICFTVMMALLPAAFRSHETARDLLTDVTSDVMDMSLPSTDDVNRVKTILTVTFLGNSFWTSYMMLATILQRLLLCLFFFFLLSVAERTFKQRFLYAKLFSHLTSSRRSRRSELPYFRLNKVRNIKTWLSVRSYLKKHGPQRSVDVIVSAAFVIALLLISFLCIQILKENDHFDDCLYNWEVLAWSFALGVYLLRFMTLGAKINKKYRNFSVLLTEQINLYVQMEQKPQKKEGLVLANNVLKLASQLLKELESPFKISGLSANPYLYNVTKLVILSAFSAVLTELLGFKLKLYKIKIK